MRYQVRHLTRYRYPEPVFINPHTLRLRPRCDASQHLLEFSLRITPEPAGLTEYIDPEGNPVAEIWFEGRTRELSIASCFKVETRRSNPFDYILTDAGVLSLPVAYSSDLALRLAACRDGSQDRAVAELAAKAEEEAGGRTPDFLNLLCRNIHRSLEVVFRPEGEPWPPRETLARGCGSCRDLAVLFIASCRARGLAARFVSGYQEGAPDAGRYDLHAWAEVYLPGGGWRGYDPTLGLAVADRHIPVAASMIPSGAAPVTGSFHGAGLGARLDFELDISSF